MPDEAPWLMPAVSDNKTGNLERIFKGGFKVPEKIDSNPPETDFSDVLHDSGFVLDGPVVADGKIHRIRHRDDKKGRKSGWYVLFLDGLAAGAYGNWKEDFSAQWCAVSERELTEKEQAENLRRMEAAKAEREKERAALADEAAERAANLLNEGSPVESHPYLHAKGVNAFGLVALSPAGKLVVPIQNAAGEIRNAQTISQDGSKRFLFGGEKKGCFFAVGALTARRVWIVEGYSTGATIHAATGETVVVAFDAGNLRPVAEAIRCAAPYTEIVIAGDNDQYNEINIGAEKARAAAEAVGGRALVPDFPDTTESPTDWNDLQQQAGLDAVKRQLDALKPAFEFTPASDLISEPKPISWLIRGYLERETVSFMFGDPASGKSLLAIEWGACIATGSEWNGVKVEQGAVFYIAGEGYSGLGRRLKALELGKELDVKAAPFFISKTAAQFLDAGNVAGVVAAIDQLADQHGKPALVIIDTLHRNLGAGDENSSTDMAVFFNRVDSALKERYGASVLVVHHSGHGDKKRARGSSSIRGGADAEYMVEKTDSLVTLSCQKLKDGEMPLDSCYRIEPVSLPWKDDEGEAVTSVILQSTDDEPQELKKRQPIRGAQRIALDVLAEALAKDGTMPPPEEVLRECGDETHHFMSVTSLHIWKELCFKRGLSESNDAEANRKAFNRAKAGLVEKKAIRIWDYWVWIPVKQ